MLTRYLPAAFLAIWLGCPSAFAECHWNLDETFYTCEGFGIRNGVGLSLPAVSDVIAINPASLPSIPTPIGVEGIYSSRTDAPGGKKADVSIIRGFKGIGFGLGTWNGDSFADPNLAQFFATGPYQAAYQAMQQQSSTRPGFQFGTSIEIPNPVKMLGHFSIGASVGELPSSNTLTRDFGATWVWRWLTANYSYGIETASSSLPQIKTATLTAGLQYDELSLLFSRASTDAGSPQPITSTYSLRWMDDRWSIYGAFKTYVNDIGDTQLWATGSIHRTFGGMFSIGYIYGRYQHSHSMSAQFYF